MQTYRVLGVIPARYQSTRFPGKVLKLLHGKPMVEWVWRLAKKAATLDEVWIATDDRRVFEAAEGFGAKAVMTSDQCRSGSDRVAEAVAQVETEFVVNIQGDEPQIEPGTIDAAVQALRDDPGAAVSTARVAIHKREDFENPHVVKVVTGANGRALYFSRSPIPSPARSGQSQGMPAAGYKHLGLYVYRKQALLEFRGLAPTALEIAEQLEQLRYLENGYAIQVVDAQRDSIGVDTPEELEALAEIFSPESVK